MTRLISRLNFKHNIYLMVTFSESDEPSANMDNYASVSNNKMLYDTADVAVKEKTRVFNNFTNWKKWRSSDSYKA